MAAPHYQMPAPTIKCVWGGGREMNFPQVLLENTMEKPLNEKYYDQDWWQRLKNSY